MKREQDTGRFRFQATGRVCVCGHADKVHYVGTPHACNNAVDGNRSPCSCPGFKTRRPR